MSDRELSLLLEDIRTAITTILEFFKGFSFEQYESDLKTRYAIERNFEIIGEATSHIPQHYKDQHPHIEWRIIKDFRNFIIHDYFGNNHQIVWDTIKLRLPDLLKGIEALLSGKELGN